MNKRKTSTGGVHRGPIAEAIFDALDKYFNQFTHVRFRELWVDVGILVDGMSGFQWDTSSRIDYWAMAVYNLGPLKRDIASTAYAIEVKIARSDFKAEQRMPQKQRWALRYSNRFYYCAPKGLIRPKELPPYAGLLEYKNGTIVETIEAPLRRARPPRWRFVASLLRRVRYLHEPRSN